MSPTTRSHLRRHGPEPGGPSPVETLTVLVDVLDRAIPAEAQPMAFVLRGSRLGAADTKLQGFAASDLFGWTAPADVQAIGVVGSGTPHALPGAGGTTPSGPLDATRTRTPGQPVGGSGGAGDDPAAGDDFLRAAAAGGDPVQVVIAMDRAGTVRGRITVAGVRRDEAPAGGRLHDAISRCLGLPTPPPETSPAVLIATLWLGALADATADRVTPLGWPEALALHPAAQALAGLDVPASECELRAAVRLAPAAWDWEWLRRQDASTADLDQLCPSELAGWMDSGMFSRWVLEGMTPLPALMASLRPRLSADALAEIAAVLADGPP